MENIAQKAYFLRNEYADKLRTIKPDAERRWGKMNAQQMIEHMADYISIASGKAGITEINTPQDQLEKYQAFLTSEKDFRENTPNVLMPEMPLPVRHGTMDTAIDELQDELHLFFKNFEESPDKKTINPIFGELDYEMNVQLLHKHAWHHLRQFGITE